jgi:hypothetical protein
VSVRRDEFPPGGMRGNPKDGFRPPCGSAAPHAPDVSGLAGRPSSTAAMTACRAVRASPDPVADGRWASLRVSPRRLAGRSTRQRHSNERVAMTEDEAARITARLKEVEEKVMRLEEIARRVAEKAPPTSSVR